MKTQQVKFRLKCDKNYSGGILVDDKYIICGRCGVALELENVAELYPYPDWIDINDAITGE